MATVMTFLLGQAFFAVIWAQQHDGELTELKHSYAMHVAEQRREMDVLQARIDRMDISAVRVEEHQSEMFRRMDQQDNRMNYLFRRIEELRQAR